MSDSPSERHCWCGHPDLGAYSDDYSVCRACGTLVSRASVIPQTAQAADDASQELYSKTYWNERQTKHHGLPDIVARARLDLPERCTYWLETLLRYRPPPGRVLEVGCGNGGFVALLGWAGFKAVGTEMSPWVVNFARETFGIDVYAGPIEAQAFGPGSFDVIVLNDVIEHLADPAGTLKVCAELLSEGGFFLIQTPEYIEHLSYRDLVAADDLFLRHMDGNNDEHLYLYSRRSAGRLFSALGFPQLDFHAPLYGYDMYFTASRRPLAVSDRELQAASLVKTPSSRLVLALLDKAYESNDRAWAIKRLEAELAAKR